MLAKFILFIIFSTVHLNSGLTVEKGITREIIKTDGVDLNSQQSARYWITKFNESRGSGRFVLPVKSAMMKE